MGNRRYERVGRGEFTRGTGRERLARRRSAREQERKKGDERPCGHGSVFRENASSSLALLERLPPRLIGRFTRCLLLVALHPQSIIPVVDVPRLLRQYVEAPWPPMRKRESERAPAVGLLGGCAVGGQLDTKTRAARVAYWCALRGSIFKFLPYMHTPPRPGESQGHTRISHVGMIRRNRHAPGPRERRTHPPTNTYNEHHPPPPLPRPFCVSFMPLICMQASRTAESSNLLREACPPLSALASTLHPALHTRQHDHRPQQHHGCRIPPALPCSPSPIPFTSQLQHRGRGMLLRVRRPLCVPKTAISVSQHLKCLRAGRRGRVDRVELRLQLLCVPRPC